MKQFLFVLALFGLMLSASAQTITTATLTVTNTSGVAVASTITVNGVTRTAANPVTAAATQFLSGSTIGESATNIFNALALTRPPNADVFQLSTNAIILKSYIGSPMVVTISAGWGTVSTTSTTPTNTTVMRGPMAVTGDVERTNTATAIVDYLNNNKSTSTVSASANPFTNFVNTSTAQIVAGAKMFTGANVLSNSAQFITGGGISNMALTNITYFQGSNGIIWNIYLVNATMTNGANYGLPFRSPSGTDSEQFGLSSSAPGDASVAFGNTAFAAGDRQVAVGFTSTAQGIRSVAVGQLSNAHGIDSVAIGSEAISLGDNSTTLGAFSEADGVTSTAIGYGATTTANGQVRLGRSSENVSVAGGLQVDGSISNATFAGSVTLNNELIVTSFNNSSLANGNNAGISVSTNAYVTIASGPSALFTIAGIAGGVSGRVVTLENTTAQSMVIANESGLDATAANRIKTGYTADVTYTNNPGCVTLRYSGTLSRWVLVSHN